MINKNLIILPLFVFLFMKCENQATQSTKSESDLVDFPCNPRFRNRVAQVEALPYRNIVVPEDVKDEVLLIGSILWDSISTIVSDNPIIIKGNTPSLFEVIEVSDDQTFNAIKQKSYALWECDRLLYTAVVVIAGSYNVQNGSQTDFGAIIIEHTKLTGTVTIGYSIGMKEWDEDEVAFMYTDRN